MEFKEISFPCKKTIYGCCKNATAVFIFYIVYDFILSADSHLINSPNKPLAVATSSEHGRFL